jgi:formate-dependent nitrite reductase cytochrome c552 subunit
MDPELAYFRTREAWDAHIAAAETRRLLDDLKRAKLEYDQAVAKLQEALDASRMILRGCKD